MHDILLLRTSAIRRRLYLGRRLDSHQDEFALLATYRGGRLIYFQDKTALPFLNILQPIAHLLLIHISILNHIIIRRPNSCNSNILRQKLSHMIRNSRNIFRIHNPIYDAFAISVNQIINQLIILVNYPLSKANGLPASSTS